jgi:hypothetical protein
MENISGRLAINEETNRLKFNSDGSRAYIIDSKETHFYQWDGMKLIKVKSIKEK